MGDNRAIRKWLRDMSTDRLEEAEYSKAELYRHGKYGDLVIKGSSKQDC